MGTHFELGLLVHERVTTEGGVVIRKWDVPTLQMRLDAMEGEWHVELTQLLTSLTMRMVAHKLCEVTLVDWVRDFRMVLSMDQHLDGWEDESPGRLSSP